MEPPAAGRLRQMREMIEMDLDLRDSIYNQTKVLAFRVPLVYFREFEALAERMERKVSEVGRFAIRDYLLAKGVPHGNIL